MRLSILLFRFATALIFIASASLTAETRALSPASASSQRQADSHKEYPPDEVGLLKQKVEQLQAVVEKQQSLIEDLGIRVKKLEEKQPSGPQGDGRIRGERNGGQR